MAAGMSLTRDNFQAFAKAFDEEVRRQLTHNDLSALVMSDGELNSHDFNLTLAQQLREAGPWGQHFPEPIFDGEFFIVQQKLLGEKHLKMSLAIDVNGQQLVDAIAFNIDPKVWPNPNAKKIRMAYRLDVNEFRGTKTVQLMVDYMDVVG